MELVEELSYVARLRPQARAGTSDDGGIQSQALRDVDAGGRAGNTDFQFISRLQRGLVESYRRVQNSGSVGRVDLERRVVRRNNGYATDGTKTPGDRYG